MRWIDLENRKPTDTNIPGWNAWTQPQWQAWKDKSQDLVKQMAALVAAGKIKERNDLIDQNKSHWDALKPWLLALSDGKCWFSEVRDLFSHYDVEHFRPKKAAKDIKSRPARDGYWWQAFDYMNFRICGNVGNRKKGGWFPLQAGSLCSTFARRCEESEDHYFIDPIVRSDVGLIAFDDEGKIIPIPGASAWQRERVEQTVLRLKLDEHPALLDERRKIWAKVDSLIKAYQLETAKCAQGGNPGARQKAEMLARQIHEHTDPHAELSAVARWCVLFRNDPALSKLVA